VYPSHLLGVAIVVRREEKSREEKRREERRSSAQAGNRSKGYYQNAHANVCSSALAPLAPLPRSPSAPHRATRSSGYSLGIPASI